MAAWTPLVHWQDRYQLQDEAMAPRLAPKKGVAAVGVALDAHVEAGAKKRMALVSSHDQS